MKTKNECFKCCITVVEHSPRGREVISLSPAECWAISLLHLSVYQQCTLKQVHHCTIRRDWAKNCFKCIDYNLLSTLLCMEIQQATISGTSAATNKQTSAFLETNFAEGGQNKTAIDSLHHQRPDLWSGSFERTHSRTNRAPPMTSRATSSTASKTSSPCWRESGENIGWAKSTPGCFRESREWTETSFESLKNFQMLFLRRD